MTNLRPARQQIPHQYPKPSCLRPFVRRLIRPLFPLHPPERFRHYCCFPVHLVARSPRTRLAADALPQGVGIRLSAGEHEGENNRPDQTSRGMVAQAKIPAGTLHPPSARMSALPSTLTPITATPVLRPDRQHRIFAQRMAALKQVCQTLRPSETQTPKRIEPIRIHLKPSKIQSKRPSEIHCSDGL